MRIDDVSVTHVAMPRRHRTVTAAPGRTIASAGDAPTVSHFFIVALTTDTGVTGFGEVSDFEEELGIPDARDLEAELAALLVGHDPFAIESIMAGVRFDRAIIDAAVDNALYDIQGKALGVSVSELIGGRVRSTVPVSWVVYIRDSALVTAEMEEAIERHSFEDFKLKVGLDIDHDEHSLSEIRRIAGPHATIKLDAQGNWSPGDAVRNIRRLSRYGLLGVESPVIGRGAADLAAVRRVVDVPIIEHVDRDFGRALDLIRMESVDAFNVATCWAGGISRAKKLMALAQMAEIDVLMGSTVELGLGTAAQLAVAGSSPQVNLPSDLIGPGLYVDDIITRAFEYDAGALHVPTGAGLGVTIDPRQLQQYAYSPKETHVVE